MCALCSRYDRRLAWDTVGSLNGTDSLWTYFWNFHLHFSSAFSRQLPGNVCIRYIYLFKCHLPYKVALSSLSISQRLLWNFNTNPLKISIALICSDHYQNDSLRLIFLDHILRGKLGVMESVGSLSRENASPASQWHFKLLNIPVFSGLRGKLIVENTCVLRTLEQSLPERLWLAVGCSATLQRIMGRRPWKK